MSITKALFCTVLLTLLVFLNTYFYNFYDPLLNLLFFPLMFMVAIIMAYDFEFPLSFQKLKMRFEFESKLFSYQIISLLIVWSTYLSLTLLLNSNNLDSSSDTVALDSQVFIVLILAPIFEELLFRGIILKQLTENYSVKKSVIVSSLFFGLTHLFSSTPLVALVGLFFGYVYVFSNRNLLLVIMLHSLSNTVSVIFLNSSSMLKVYLLGLNNWYYATFVIIGLLFLFGWTNFLESVKKEITK